MKKKLISNTYLRDVNKYSLKMYINDDYDYYLSVKKIIDIKEPFIVSNGLCLINNEYYILELIPKFENYAMRVFFNDKKEILEYYFDISLGNGLDEESKIPYYDDLYTDVTVRGSRVEVLDEDELEEALKLKKISLNDYNLAYSTKEKLLKEIKSKTNKYMNLDLANFLD